MNSVCKFVLANPRTDEMHIINFVYEHNPRQNAKLSVSTVCRICYVTSGSAHFSIAKNNTNLKAGDIFFVLSGENFAILGDEDFRYMYVSVLGSRLNLELDRLKINAQNCVFRDVKGMKSTWEYAIQNTSDAIDLVCKGVVYLTLAAISEYCITKNEESFDDSKLPLAFLIKKFIDENFKSPDFCRKSIAEKFSYSEQYVSKIFALHYKIRIGEYVNTMRVNFASSLFDKNYKNVAEIAYASGFTDALYFSKVFKRKIGLSPKQYLKSKSLE